MDHVRGMLIEPCGLQDMYAPGDDKRTRTMFLLVSPSVLAAQAQGALLSKLCLQRQMHDVALDEIWMVCTAAFCTTAGR